MAYIKEWFKVIKNGELIGVVTEQSFARYSEKSGRSHICQAVNGEYVILNDKYYHDDWMFPINAKSYIDYENATVISISKKEYDILSSGEEMPVKNEIVKNPAEEILEKVSENEEVTIDFVRAKKFKELRHACTEAIEKGFDLMLADGLIHHFSMTDHDQLNLLQMEIELNNGSNDILYHADNELMQYFGIDDVQYILSAAKRWKDTNLALFNSLKNWINNLHDLETIDSITYDSEIPEMYRSEILKTLLYNI